VGIICASFATFKPFLWTYFPQFFGAMSRNRSYPQGSDKSGSSKKWSRKASGVTGDSSTGTRSHRSYSLGTWSKKQNKNDLESCDYGKLDGHGQTTVTVQEPSRDLSAAGSQATPRGSTDHIIRSHGGTGDRQIMKTTQVLVRDEEKVSKTQDQIAGHYPS
jgi:hypothetical protein